MNALVNLGVQVPAEIDRMGELFLKAHALASWKEAEYWEAWARAEGEVVSQQAFLFGHPWRAYRELEAVAKLLRTVGVEVHRPSGRELAEAERFYAGKGVTRQVPW